MSTSGVARADLDEDVLIPPALEWPLIGGVAAAIEGRPAPLRAEPPDDLVGAVEPG